MKKYQPSKKWILEAFLLGAFLFSLALLLNILEHQDQGIIFAIAFSLVVWTLICFLFTQESILIIEDGDVTQHDLWIKRTIKISDITAFRKTKKGYFGTLDIVSQKQIFSLNLMFFDEKTIKELYAELKKRNSLIQDI